MSKDARQLSRDYVLRHGFVPEYLKAAADAEHAAEQAYLCSGGKTLPPPPEVFAHLDYAALRARLAAEQEAVRVTEAKQQESRRARREGKAAAERAAAIAEACLEAGHPERAASFLRQRLTITEVKAKLDHLGGLQRQLRAAKRQAPSADWSDLEALALTGLDAKEFGRRLMDRLCDVDAPDINATRITPREREARTDSGWDRAVAAVHGEAPTNV